MEQHNYYSRGSRENIIISNSSMSAINPEQQGTPLKFLEFFDDNKEEKHSRYLNNGKLVHSYIEDKDNFAIDDLVKPTEKVALWVEELIKLLNSDLDIPNQSDTIKDYSDSLDELIQGISMFLDVEINKESLIDHLEYARSNVGYYANRKANTTFGTFVSEGAIPYLLFKLQNSDKTILTVADRDIVENAIESLESNKYLRKRLFVPQTDDFTMYKEIGMLFTFEHKLKNGTVVKLKGKILIDVLQCDFKNGVYIINDLKTTGKSIYDMSPNKSRNQLGAIQSFRYHRQLGWYKFGLMQLIKGNGICINSKGEQITLPFPKINPKIYTEIVAVETHGEFLSRIVPLNDAWLNKGLKECTLITERIAWHINEGKWDSDMEYYLNNGCISVENP